MEKHTIASNSKLFEILNDFIFLRKWKKTGTEKASMNELKKTPLKFWLHILLHVNRTRGLYLFIPDCWLTETLCSSKTMWEPRLALPAKKTWHLHVLMTFWNIFYKKFSFYIEYQLTKATHNNYYTILIANKSSRTTQGEIRKSQVSTK